MKRTLLRLAPLASAMIVGLVISVWPHLQALWNSGNAAWVADYDDRFYLSVGSQAYFNHPLYLSDPVRATGGPSLYKPLPLLPGVWLARLAGVGPLGVGIAWRVLAGLSIGAAWYLLLRRTSSAPLVALGVAVLFLSDGGLTEGRPIFRQVRNITHVATGHTQNLFDRNPRLHPEWRISTPGVTMVYLLAFLWAMAFLRERPTLRRVAIASAAFGLLFYVYFYYWTAAGLALLIACAIDRVNCRHYLMVGTLGTLIGLPSVISDYLLKRGTSSDWLQRTDKFLSIGHFSELHFSKVNTVLLIVLFVWILWRRREFIFPWALVASAMLLANHQMITGLQIENFHWDYVSGPVFSFILVCVILKEIEELARRYARLDQARFLFALAIAAMFVSGVWLRALDASRSRTCVDNAQALAEFFVQKQGPARNAFTPNVVIAGDSTFVDFAVILENLRPLSNYSTLLSPTVTDLELEERMALDGLLNGQNRSDFASERHSSLERNHWGPWGRDANRLRERVQAFAEAYDRVASDIDEYLAKYGVRYVALPVGTEARFLTERWKPIESGPIWNVWEFKTP